MLSPKESAINTFIKVKTFVEGYDGPILSKPTCIHVYFINKQAPAIQWLIYKDSIISTFYYY